MTCKICGQTFAPKVHNQDVCSGECRRIRDREVFRAWRKKNPRAVKAQKPSGFTCPRCRKSHFRPNSGKWRFCLDCEHLVHMSPDNYVDHHLYRVGGGRA